jgi:hypothetical protein
MSRGRGLPVTLSAAKRTFATQKGACVMDSGVGSQTRWESLRILDVLTPVRAGVMGPGRSVNLMAGYDIWSGEIRLWSSRIKRERPRCGARCRDGSPCKAPPVWDKRLDRAVNGRCRMHGGLSTDQRRKRAAGASRNRTARAQRARRQERSGANEKR